MNNKKQKEISLHIQKCIDNLEVLKTYVDTEDEESVIKKWQEIQDNKINKNNG